MTDRPIVRPMFIYGLDVTLMDREDVLLFAEYNMKRSPPYDKMPKYEKWRMELLRHFYCMRSVEIRRKDTQ